MVFDLVVPANKRCVLPVKWDKRIGFYAQNLSVVECGNLRHLLQLIASCARHRQVAQSTMNARPSRSHCMLNIFVDLQDKNGGVHARYGKVALVDLVGSERLSDHTAGAGKKMTRETGQINKRCPTNHLTDKKFHSVGHLAASASLDEHQPEGQAPRSRGT
jgi:hypothetical protein